MINKLFIGISFLMVFSTVLHAQQLRAGLKIQKTHTLYYENGIAVQYSFKNFKPHKLVLGFDLVSSRLGSAFRSNAIKQESYLASAAWLFRPEKQFQLYTRLNLGFFYSDLEFEIFDELPNKSMLLSPEIGVSYTIPEYNVKLQLGSGYYYIKAKSGYSPGTLQPLYYHFDILYQLPLFKKADETLD